MSHRELLSISIFILLFHFWNPNDLYSSSLSGYLIDSETGEKLYEGNVYLKDSKLGLSTNKAGYFYIGNITPGSYVLVAEFIGYQKSEIELSIGYDENIKQNIELTAAVINMEQIVFEQSVSDRVVKNPGNTVNTNPFDLRFMTEFAQPDLIRKIQMTPGIVSVSDYSTGMYIRGSDDDHNLILYDDMIVYNPSHLFGVFSSFITDALKSSKLTKSAYSAKYGGRMGSVLDIQSREGNSKKWEGSISTSVFSTDCVISGPGPGRSGYLLAVRRTHLDPVLNYFDLPSYYFWDMQSQIYYDFCNGDKIIISSYAGGDRLQEDDDDLYYDIDWHNLNFSMRWTHVISPQIISYLKTSTSNFIIKHKHRIDADDNLLNFYNNLEGDNCINELSLKNDYSYYYSNDAALNFGFEINKVKVDYNETTEDEKLWDLTSNSFNGGLFSELEWSINNQFFIQPGLRLNYFHDLISSYKFQLAPRFLMEFTPDRENLFSLSYGRFYQTMFTIQHEHMPIKVVNLWFSIDDSVKPGISDSYTVGWQKKIRFMSDDYVFSTDFYYKEMNNLLDFRDKADSFSNGVKIKDIFTSGSAYSYGAEIMISKNKGRFNGNLSYTLSRVKKKSRNGEKEFSPYWDIPHTIKGDMNYHFNNSFSVGTDIVYACGRPYENSYFYILQYDDGSEVYVKEYGNKDGKRYPNYFRWDISANYSWFFSEGKMLLLNLTLTNVTNHKNIQEFYNEKVENGRIVRDQFNMFPFVPSFRINYSF